MNPIRTLLILSLFSLVPSTFASEPNTLTAEEQADGWRLLFDGKTTKGWSDYPTGEPPAAGWAVEDGALHKKEGENGGNIISGDTYENFEFAWEWKLLEGGNNGVKYMITRERGEPVGHEYQMIDDIAGHVPDEYSSVGSFYLVVKPRADKPVKPMGEWNSSRILVRGNHAEHWLNGMKVLEYECGSPEIMAQISETKFKKYPGFGEKVAGYIMLTDHKDPCWYRNLKIRALE